MCLTAGTMGTETTKMSPIYFKTQSSAVSRADCMMYVQCLRKFSLLGLYLGFLMRHQPTEPVSPAPGDFLPRAHRPQEVDQRGVYDGLRVQNEANKKLIRDVIISRAARCRPCQDLNYFAGFLIELLFFVLFLGTIQGEL